MKAKYIGLLFIASAVLAACGGGGSSGSSAPLAKVTINSQNQAPVTKSAVNSATQNFSSYTSFVGVQTTGTSSNDPLLTKYTKVALAKLAANQGGALSVAGVVVATYQCSGIAGDTSKGNFTFDTDGTQNTAPTYFTISFNACVEGGVTTNGTVSMTNMSITKNAQGVLSSVSATFTFNLTETGTVTNNLVGSFTISATGMDTTTETDSMTGASLAFSAAGVKEEMSNFSFVVKFDGTATSPAQYSFNNNYTISSGSLGKSFTVKTITPIVKDTASAYPMSGQIVIIGEASTALRVTIVSVTTLTLEIGTVSSAGVFTIDPGQTVQTLTWASIAAS